MKCDKGYSMMEDRSCVFGAVHLNGGTVGRNLVASFSMEKSTMFENVTLN
jgi:hypothetical protein